MTGLAKKIKFCDELDDISGTPRLSSLQKCAPSLKENANESSDFVLGEILRYSRDGFTSHASVWSVKKNTSTLITTYTIKLKCGRVLETTKEFIQHLDDPNIAKIPLNHKEYFNEIHNFSPSDLKHITKPQTLTTDEEEWLD